MAASCWVVMRLQDAHGPAWQAFGMGRTDRHPGPVVVAALGPPRYVRRGRNNEDLGQRTAEADGWNSGLPVSPDYQPVTARPVHAAPSPVVAEHPAASPLVTPGTLSTPSAAWGAAPPAPALHPHVEHKPAPEPAPEPIPEPEPKPKPLPPPPEPEPVKAEFEDERKSELSKRLFPMDEKPGKKPLKRKH